ncbi:MAG: MATE family efflux transporter [Eubacteriales bacterium]|nr:MATE family efflux transporter [Eubacteriales bacterium]
MNFGKLARFFGAQDMTVGKPWKCLVQFAVPLLIGNVAQQFYNTADAIIVGKYIGDTALAAVGASGPVINLLLVLFVGISTGAGIMVSQFFGAKQEEKLSHTVGSTLTLTVFASVIIMVLGTLLSRPLMSMLNTPPEIYDGACSYLMIIFIGIAGFSFFNVVSGILRGLGDSITPLLFLLLACALNVGLDILFVAKFNWGVPGVAIATVLAQVLSAVFCVVRLVRMKDVVQVNASTLKPHKELAWQIIRLGLPSGLTQAIFSLAMIVVQSLTNSFGTAVVACTTVVMRVDGFAMMPNFTFGIAMTTFAGQNIGANRMDRVNRGTRDGLLMAVATSILLTASILIFGKTMMSWFSDTPEVIRLGMRMMRIIAAGYIAMAVTQVLSGTMRGAGDTMTPMWISLITTVVIRVPIAYIWAWLTRTGATLSTGSSDSIFFSLLICWVLGALLTALFFRVGKWRKKAVVKYDEAVPTAQE